MGDTAADIWECTGGHQEEVAWGGAGGTHTGLEQVTGGDMAGNTCGCTGGHQWGYQEVSRITGKQHEKELGDMGQGGGCAFGVGDVGNSWGHSRGQRRGATGRRWR